MSDDLQTKNFKVGVTSVVDDKTLMLFINPSNFSMTDNPSQITNEDIQDARNQIEAQYPGESSILKDDDIRGIIHRTTLGESARKDTSIYFDQDTREIVNNTICTVVGPNDIDSKEFDADGFTANLPFSSLKDIPGSDAIWARIIGIHEGEHCNQDKKKLNSDDIQTLTREMGADQKVIKWLEDNDHDDVAQAFIDYRTLGSAHGGHVDHATGLALSTSGHTEITEDYVKAAAEVGSRVLQAVSDEHKLGSQANALKMLERNPGRFVRTIERAIERGEFKDENNPDLESHVQAYTQAFRRQIDGITPPVASQNNITSFNQVDINDIKGGEISVDLASGDSASMTIGEVNASDFFASFAHPELANQRIALQEAAIDPVLDFSINQNNAATMSV